MHRWILMALLTVVGSGPFVPSSVSPSTIRVSNNAELVESLQDERYVEIRLEPGNYSNIVIENRLAGTHITSDDLTDRAVVNGWVWVKGSENVSLTNLDVDIDSLATFEDWHPALSITESSTIRVTGLTLDGHVIGPGEGVDPSTIQPGDPNPGAIVGYPYGDALWVRFSTDVQVEATEIRDFRLGVFAQNSENLAFSQIWMHGLRAEGFNLEDLRNVSIENSRIEDFTPWLNSDGSDSDHADMIQFWGVNSEWGIEGLTIANNLFLQTRGDWTQTIFGGLSGGDPDSVRFSDFSIHDNLIVNSHLHGITLGNVTDSTVHHNLLLPAAGWSSANSTGGIPKIYLPDGDPPAQDISVLSNILVAPEWQDVPGGYFDDATALELCWVEHVPNGQRLTARLPQCLPTCPRRILRRTESDRSGTGRNRPRARTPLAPVWRPSALRRHLRHGVHGRHPVDGRSGDHVWMRYHTLLSR